jgi:hypothetical protein
MPKDQPTIFLMMSWLGLAWLSVALAFQISSQSHRPYKAQAVAWLWPHQENMSYL